LHTILTRALAGEQSLADDDLAQLLDLFELQFVDEHSLMAPTRAAPTFVPDATPPPSLTEGEIAEAQRQTLAQMRRSIGRERVRQFAAALLRERETVRASEIPLNGPDDLPLVIYLRAYGTEAALGYTIEEAPDGDWIEHDDVGFRDFVLRRTPEAPGES
jgi:hypothetical protein